jgi:hypothetical protein
LSKKQRGAKAGTKMPKRINLPLWSQLQAAQGGEVHGLTGAGGDGDNDGNDDNVEPDEPDEKLMECDSRRRRGTNKELVKLPEMPGMLVVKHRGKKRGKPAKTGLEPGPGGEKRVSGKPGGAGWSPVFRNRAKSRA